MQKIITTAGDIALPDISRQFLYQPSVKAIKDAAVKRNAAAEKTYSGSGVDLDFSFSYPAAWSVAGSDGQLTVGNATGAEMASLSVLLVWGAEGPGLSADVSAQANYGNFSIQEPKGPCASCTQHVSSTVVDSRTAKASIPIDQDPASLLGWPQPVMVSTTVTAQQAPLDKVDPRYLAGINVVDAGVKGANGGETRVVIFEGHKFFPSVAEAKAWMASAEHLQVEKMMASIRFQ